MSLKTWIAGEPLNADDLNGNFALFTSSFTPNAGETINGATLPVPVYQNKTDNEVYSCDANDTSRLKFLGFATTDSTDGNPITVITNGIVSGFTGLAEGEKYYVQDTVGTIGTSPGTAEVLVGIALSTTTLLITRGGRYHSGRQQFSATGTTAITTGFRPSLIKATAYFVDSTSGEIWATSSGVWRPSGHSCIYINADDGSPVSTVSGNDTYLVNLYMKATEYWRVAITSVTDTGFTFNVTEVNTANDMVMVYEVYGDF